MRKTFDHRIQYGQMDDRAVRRRAKLMSSGVNSKKVGWRISIHTVVPNTFKFVLDTIVNG